MMIIKTELIKQIMAVFDGYEGPYWRDLDRIAQVLAEQIAEAIIHKQSVTIPLLTALDRYANVHIRLEDYKVNEATVSEADALRESITVRGQELKLNTQAILVWQAYPALRLASLELISQYYNALDLPAGPIREAKMRAAFLEIIQHARTCSSLGTSF